MSSANEQQCYAGNGSISSRGLDGAYAAESYGLRVVVHGDSIKRRG